MFIGPNYDRKSQFSGILTEPLNPRGLRLRNSNFFFIKRIFLQDIFLKNHFFFKIRFFSSSIYTYIDTWIFGWFAV